MKIVLQKHIGINKSILKHYSNWLKFPSKKPTGIGHELFMRMSKV